MSPGLHRALSRLERGLATVGDGCFTNTPDGQVRCGLARLYRHTRHARCILTEGSWWSPLIRGEPWRGIDSASRPQCSVSLVAEAKRRRDLNFPLLDLGLLSLCG